MTPLPTGYSLLATDSADARKSDTGLPGAGGPAGYHATLHNLAAAAINGIESNLGLEAQGSFPSVAARLTALESAPNLSGSAGADLFRARVTADAQARFTINADGPLEWGSGAAALDTNLYRSAANQLRTDDAFAIGAAAESTLHGGAGVAFATTGVATITRAANNQILYAGLVGDAESRFQIDAVGLHRWGAGAGAPDVTLFRQEAGALRTNGAFQAASDLTARIAGAGQIALGAVGPGALAGMTFGSAADTNLYRSAANVLSTEDSLTIGGNLRLTEEAVAPAAPAADGALFYAIDNGAGKTQVMVRFNTGAAQQIAIQP